MINCCAIIIWNNFRKEQFLVKAMEKNEEFKEELKEMVEGIMPLIEEETE